MQISSTHRQADCDAGHYRRFKGYDYSRGVALFITFAVSKRKKVFGAIDGEGRLVHSPAGAAALSTLAIEERRRGDIVVEKSVIMPDHVHMRLYLRPGIDRPLARLARAADMGYVFAGTFISPCERTAAAMLAERGAPIIKAVPDPLAMVYRPKGDEPRQFADGRLLLLSRVAAPGVSRYDAWHGINDAIASFAMAAKGGLSLYVTSTKDFNFKFASS